MSGLFASWIHGNSLIAEQSPGDTGLLSLMHYGWGTVVKIRSGHSVWFHVPIPTPVIVNDERLSLVKFFILFKQLSEYGAIMRVHLWDGSRKVADQYKNRILDNDGNLVEILQGDELAIGIGSEFELLEPAKAWSGFGVSFQISAPGLPMPPGARAPFDAEFTIASAGGDFR